jgi:X-Pro dipeptidyl-peptidase
MKLPLIYSSFLLFFGLSLSSADARETDSFDEIPKPIFKNGEAQIVPEFSSSEEWIKEELWVETSFDSDMGW